MTKVIEFIALMVLLSLSVSLQANHEREDGLVHIYYVAFRMDTYEPITEGNIEQKAVFLGREKKDSEEIRGLYRTISSLSREDFDVHMVRLKIVDNDGNLILVDVNGNVKSDHLPHYFESIPEVNAFQSLKLKINALIETNSGHP